MNIEKRVYDGIRGAVDEAIYGTALSVIIDQYDQTTFSHMWNTTKHKVGLCLDYDTN